MFFNFFSSLVKKIVLVFEILIRVISYVTNCCIGSFGGKKLNLLKKDWILWILHFRALLNNPCNVVAMFITNHDHHHQCPCYCYCCCCLRCFIIIIESLAHQIGVGFMSFMFPLIPNWGDILSLFIIQHVSFHYLIPSFFSVLPFLFLVYKTFMFTGQGLFMFFIRTQTILIDPFDFHFIGLLYSFLILLFLWFCTSILWYACQPHALCLIFLCSLLHM